MFGAWQAGAWQTLSASYRPDLVVGASVGSLNGYAIAAGWSPRELCDWWRHSSVGFDHLPEIAQALLAARPLELDYAVVLVDPLRMRPRTFSGSEVTARHLLASCALPGAFPPQKINGVWYVDGGLLNPLPVWAAVELGATRIVALNALPEFPAAILRPFAKAFRRVFGHNPPLPPDVELITLLPSRPLGGLRDAVYWNRANAQRWLAQGAEDAAAKAVTFQS
jgi:predicted acylesterase/phospholipase RssA